MTRVLAGTKWRPFNVCARWPIAQAEYFAPHHDGVKQYAQKFISVKVSRMVLLARR